MKITWKDFDEAAHEIAWRFQHSNLIKIVGLQRGGLPLAVKLSNLLDVPMEVLDYQTRDGSSDLGLVDDQILKMGNLEHVLFVDDICDSGKTISDIKALYSNARFVTLCERNTGLTEFSPIRIEEMDDGWIEFPWEK